VTSSAPASDARKVRLYFALWPDAELADAMLGRGRALRTAIGGKLTRCESIHLTLAFLGDVAESRLPELLDPPAAIAVAAFTFDLDRLGAWQHNGVGWFAPDIVPPGLMLLQARLSAWLASIGFELERRPFAPHVTLVRKVRTPFETIAVEPLRWAVADYALVRSTLGPEGSSYLVIGRFTLPAAA